MSTPTEYRLLKERHEALRAAVSDLVARWESVRMPGTAAGVISRRYADDLRALLEGDTR